MSIAYRPEIDGLRTVAVAGVVVYHADFAIAGGTFLRGGFIGVDVFFVISGYLIGRIILGELAGGRFSLTGFYLRRARRILPALVVVMLPCFALGWLFMLPDEFERFAGSAAAALASVSNFWFWSEDGYFAALSALKPLLHTWSLGVEEQFYLLFPPLAWAAIRLGPRGMVAALAAVSAASLALAVAMSASHASAAFYLLPTRAWELLAGALLAQIEIGRSGRLRAGTGAARVLPAAGLALILAAAGFFPPHTPHPGLATVVPIVGTMLVIAFARPDEPVGALLSTRPFVFVGKISYSFYLWHFPAFAFARILWGEPSAAAKAGLILLSLALAVATWRLVEQPFRDRRAVPDRAFLAATGTAVALLMAAGVAVQQMGGVPSRLGPMAEVFEAAGLPVLEQDGRDCQNRPVAESCRFEGGPEVIVNVGDSHAGVLAPSLLRLAEARGAGFVTLTMEGCAYAGPGIEILRRGQPYDDCNDIQPDRRAFLLSMPPATIVLTARWPALLSGEGFDDGEGRPENTHGPASWPFLLTAGGRDARDPGVRETIRSGIVELLRAGHRVVLVYPVPEVAHDVPSWIRMQLRGVPLADYLPGWQRLDLSTSAAVHTRRDALTREVFDGLGRQERLLRVYPAEIFCDRATGRCPAFDRERIFYHDDDHLTGWANDRLADAIGAALDGADWGADGGTAEGKAP